MFPFFENLAYLPQLSVQLPTWSRGSMSGNSSLQHRKRPCEARRNGPCIGVSLLLLAIPLGYVILINGEPFWAAFAVLFAQAGSMFLLRLLGVGYITRVWLLIPVAAASVLVGAVAAAWPSVERSALQAAPWRFLCLAALAFALSGAISLYSFPIGYGERSR